MPSSMPPLPKIADLPSHKTRPPAPGPAGDGSMLELIGHVSDLHHDLGLLDWGISMEWASLRRDTVSAVGADTASRHATIYLACDVGRTIEERKADIRHEMLHIITADLCTLALERFTTEAAVLQADEALVRRLDAILSRRESP